MEYSRNLQSSRDPRGQTHPRPNGHAYDQDPRNVKRPSSRSPDGAPSRKQHRPDERMEDIHSPSRRSSISNGTPRHPGVGMPSPREPRLNTMAVQQNARNSPLSGKINSPDNRNGVKEGVSSGRSTPQHGPPKPAVATAVMSSFDGHPISQAFTSFASENAQFCSLKVADVEANAQRARAQRLYNLDDERRNFSFPAIRERRTAAQNVATSRAEVSTQQLARQTEVQRQWIQKVATFVQDAVDLHQPTISKDDFVSREELGKFYSFLLGQTRIVIRCKSCIIGGVLSVDIRTN
jgi:hypothetical protein